MSKPNSYQAQLMNLARSLDSLADRLGRVEARLEGLRDVVARQGKFVLRVGDDLATLADRVKVVESRVADCTHGECDTCARYTLAEPGDAREGYPVIHGWVSAECDQCRHGNTRAWRCLWEARP